MDIDEEGFEKDVTTGGIGFRYEIERMYSLQIGVDIAYGPEDTSVYIQFGNAWMRP